MGRHYCVTSPSGRRWRLHKAAVRELWKANDPREWRHWRSGGAGGSTKLRHILPLQQLRYFLPLQQLRHFLPVQQLRHFLPPPLQQEVSTSPLFRLRKRHSNFIQRSLDASLRGCNEHSVRCLLLRSAPPCSESMTQTLGRSQWRSIWMTYRMMFN